MLSEEDENRKRKFSRSQQEYGIIEERSVLFEEQVTPPAVTRASQTKKSVFFVPEELQDELNDVTYNEILLMSKRSSTSRPPGESISIATNATDEEEETVVKPVGLTNNVSYYIKQHRQLLTVLASIVLGFFIGFLLRARKTKYNEFELFIVKFPGQFYVRTLSAMLMPLIVASIISSMGRLNFKLGFEMLWRFILHTSVTTAIAISLAVFLTVVMAPGKGITLTSTSKTRELITTDFGILLTDIFKHALPERLFEMFYETYRTSIVYDGPSMPKDPHEQKNLLSNPDNWSYIVRTVPIPNYTGLLICSMATGFALQRLQGTNRLILRLTISVENILVVVGDWFQWFATLGKLALLIAAIVTYDSDDDPIVQDLFPYMSTLFTAFAIYVFVIIPSYFYLTTFSNPWLYFKKMHSVFFTAFTTSSSVVTLPSTLAYLEEDLDIAIIPSRLFAPLGTIINKSGSAIQIIISTLFIAQALGRDLTVWDIVTLWINAFVMSISIAPLPQESRVSFMYANLLHIGVSLEQYEGLVQKVERTDGLVDRFSTVINVYGDLISSLAVHLLMVQSAEKVGKLISVNEFLRKQEHARRISQLQSEIRLQKMSRDTSLQHSSVSEETPKKHEDLELLSVSSTLSETS